MEKTAILTLITDLAAKRGLDAALVAAVVETESAFDPWAMRYEPSYKYLVGNVESLSQIERYTQMTSWGLMQVMGAVAREYGFTGWLSKLCDPTVGLNYGMLHLNRFYTRYGSWTHAIASYNAGRPLMIEGKYVNQIYVEKVLTAQAQYRQTLGGV